jgi:N-acetylmuramoyl-L-alanine amidase
VEVADVNDRFEIIFFEGTLEEYQLILEQTLSVPDDLKDTVPVDELIDLDKVLKDRIIVIDPGHGGSDPGTIGITGVLEKEVVLPIGLQLGKYLEAAGALVVYTRKDDCYVSKFDRPKIAEVANAELYVSIHANSYGTMEAKGIETLYNPLYLDNFRLAQTIQSELSRIPERNNRGVRPRTDLAVLNNLAIPAVLVEVGFVSNAEEELLLISAEYQNQIAEGLFEGIKLFFVNY